MFVNKIRNWFGREAIECEKSASFVYQMRHGDCDLALYGCFEREITSDGRGLVTILLVEDDNGAREALHEILIHAGYSVLSAENGMHALESVKSARARPALILLDLAMPVMDGVAFLAEVPRYTHLANVPVIVMSGDYRTLVSVERPHRVVEVLPKPIDIDRMMALVCKYTLQTSHPRGDASLLDSRDFVRVPGKT